MPWASINGIRLYYHAYGRGPALVFAHGLSVRFGLVEPRADLDVILASPKGIGPRIRDLYEAGEGVFCLFGVQQDATGGAHALGLSYAAALGCGRKGIRSR